MLRLLSLPALAVFASAAVAADWPQWRGPDRTGGALLKLDADGDGVKATEVYFEKAYGPSASGRGRCARPTAGCTCGAGPATSRWSN